jgi:nucleotidyltransferase substrate binding protein (TIGR01987 family)
MRLLKIDWIDDEEQWIQMLHDRNMTSHAYKKEVAEVIYQRLEGYLILMQAAYTTIVNRIEENQ